MKNLGLLTDEEFDEIVRLYPEKHTYLERARMALRLVVRSCPDRLSSADRAWQSEEIQKHVAHLPAEEEFLRLGIALRLGERLSKSHMIDLQKLSAASKRPKYRERDAWICDQFAAGKKRNPGYSVPQFRSDLLTAWSVRTSRSLVESRKTATHPSRKPPAIEIPTGFRTLLRGTDDILSERSLRRILGRASLI